MGYNIWNEGREKAIYHPGQKVEVKHRPGIIDTVIAYDPSNVPPIVLEIDPQPRYPEELNLISPPRMVSNWLKSRFKATNNQICTG
jgi:hypothetical protein